MATPARVSSSMLVSSAEGLLIAYTAAETHADFLVTGRSVRRHKQTRVVFSALPHHRISLDRQPPRLIYECSGIPRRDLLISIVGQDTIEI
jgi:hypothetical protein